MGYFGRGSFENDEALDWLTELDASNATSKIEKALRSSLNYRVEEQGRLSEGQIRQIISANMEMFRANPPEAWKSSGLALDDYLAEIQQRLNHRYESGQYLDEEYGPVEVAIAAAELVAMWGGMAAPTYPAYPQEAMSLIAQLARNPLPSSLVRSAFKAMSQICINERYARMRKFYLSAFPALSGGNLDAMKEPEDLLGRLIKLESGKRTRATP